MFKYLYKKQKLPNHRRFTEAKTQCQCQTAPPEFYKIAMERKIAIIFRRFSISYQPILSHTRRTECVFVTHTQTRARAHAQAHSHVTHILWQAFCLSGKTENL